MGKSHYEKVVKDTIRSAIWEGMCLVKEVSRTKNPYAIQQLLENNQENLNMLTEKAMREITKLSGVIIA